MIKIQLYLIPGLGLDKHIFRKLSLEKYPIQYLDWIEPLQKESIQQYAKRYSSQLNSDVDRKVIIGHSFGGILAQEISNFVDVECIFLISSIQSRQELPWFLKLASGIQLNGETTKKWILKSFPFWGEKHGYQSLELKEIFTNSIQNLSSQYLKWAIQQLGVWNEIKYNTKKIIQIHGSLDKTFPVKLIKHPDYLIPDGDHNMLFNKGPEIAQLINKELSKISFH